MDTSQQHTASVLGRFSTAIALVSFGIGTILLGFHFLFPMNIDLYVAGTIYILAGAFLNTIVLVHLVIQIIAKQKMQEYYAIKILIILSNIPVAILYGYAVFNL